jgi:hypothetical protein
MKRDMDLVRKILMTMEGAPANGVKAFSIVDYDAEMVSYHVAIMGEAGLLIAEDYSTLHTLDYLPVRLTWAGHEFLEAVRDNSRWNQIKTQMDRTGGFVFDVAKALAISWMLQQLQLGN